MEERKQRGQAEGKRAQKGLAARTQHTCLAVPCVSSVQSVLPSYLLTKLFFFSPPLYEGTLFSACGGLSASNWEYLTASMLCGCVCPCVMPSKNRVAGEFVG